MKNVAALILGFLRRFDERSVTLCKGAVRSPPGQHTCSALGQPAGCSSWTEVNDYHPLAVLQRLNIRGLGRGSPF